MVSLLGTLRKESHLIARRSMDNKWLVLLIVIMYTKSVLISACTWRHLNWIVSDVDVCSFVIRVNYPMQLRRGVKNLESFLCCIRSLLVAFGYIQRRRFLTSILGTCKCSVVLRPLAPSPDVHKYFLVTGLRMTSEADEGNTKGLFIANWGGRKEQTCWELFASLRSGLELWHSQVGHVTGTARPHCSKEFVNNCRLQGTLTSSCISKSSDASSCVFCSCRPLQKLEKKVQLLLFIQTELTTSAHIYMYIVKR